MKLPQKETLASISKILGCSFEGNPQHSITGLNEIHRVEEGDIVFVDNKKYYDKALNSAATTILIDKKTDYPKNKALLISDNPFRDFNRLIEHFLRTEHLKKATGKNVSIADSAIIYPNVTIGNNVSIGENSIIYPGVVLMDRTRIGNNVIIGANSTIGHNAFYYKKVKGAYNRLLTCGDVHICDNVEIGTLCSIDAGVTSTTTIGEGTKLDNQIQIGHDTIIGKNCLFAANVGIAGCVTIEDNVTFWGQVGCISGVHIGEGATVLAQSGISKSLEGGKTYFGGPAQEIRTAYREMAAVRKLPEIIENL